MTQLEIGAAPPRIYTVSELCGGLRELLEEEVGRVFVAGEIQDLHRARSGHCYFTLSDERARIRAALFRGTAVRLPFDPEEGLEVVVEATPTLYAARGDLQLVVRSLEPRGQGALQLAFEQLRVRLEAEGLFEASRKRALPTLPTRLGVVTSPTGAAIRDVIQVSGERFPAIPLLISPTRVQGDGADAEIARALERMAATDVDCILLVRGGGSLEDLMAFNTERVARAIRAAPVPVVSGVGHEVDVTIADLAADLRAPTPSAAAALAVPDASSLASLLHRDQRRLIAAMEARVDRAHRKLGLSATTLRSASPESRLRTRAARLARTGAAVLAAGRSLLPPRVARLERASLRLGQAGPRAVENASRRLAESGARLDALSPLAVLGRGYAIARRLEDGRILRSAEEAEVGSRLSLRLARGELEARVEARREPPADPGSDRKHRDFESDFRGGSV